MYGAHKILIISMSVTLNFLCYCGVECCKNASFYNTNVILKGEGISTSANITGCLTANKETENITSIYATDGFVPTLFKDAVSNMPDLKEIKFVRMKLSRIERASLVNLPALHTINLALNSLRTISADMFTGLPLRSLELSSNRIYSMEKKAFDIDNLVYLGLYDNKIELFSPDWFHNSNLEMLLMAKNLLRHIPGDAFVNLRKLKVISFQMNRIIYIHEDAFKILSDIEMIDLSCNRIKSVNPNLFTFTSGGENLVNLYLNGNSLTYLPERLLDNLGNLKVFNFHGNPWQCPCYSLLKNWTDSKNIRDDHIVREDFFNHVPNCVFSLSNPDVCLESVDEEIIFIYQPYYYTDCEKLKFYFFLQREKYFLN